MQTENDENLPLKRLREALAEQRAYLAAYQKPSEPIVYETLRTFDDLFFRDLMEPGRPVEKDEQSFRGISAWGVNHALRRVTPRVAPDGPFRDFPSRATIQAQADDFVFNCGVLEHAERFEGWLREGILTGELRPHPSPKDEGMTDILILRNATSSCSDEEIGLAGLRWAGDRQVDVDRPVEEALERRHRELESELHDRVELVNDWRMVYASTPEIDEYFLEWARLYLRRKFSQDMIADDDLIGGRPFARYVDIVTALSGQCQKHIAYTAIIRARHESVHIRNLLTTYFPREEFMDSLAAYMDADRREIEMIMSSLILDGQNLDVHTNTAAMAWVPIVQASKDFLLLPMFGLDINPFLFLLTDLRFRYESDWFRIANNREHRWIEELEALFSGGRWRVHTRNLRLREGGKELTDIDFTVFDCDACELGLFQLKWQHPVGMDDRGRRSAGRNLVHESNRWVETVNGWLERHGISELMQRLGFQEFTCQTVHLFVLGRYHVHLTGFDDHDVRAVWSDWAHFQRARTEAPEATLSQLAENLRSTITQSRQRKKGESLLLPVGNIALLLNPTSVPDDTTSTI